MSMNRPADTSITHILPLSVDPGLRRSFRFGLLLEVLDRLAEQTALAYVGPGGGVRFVTAAIDQVRLRGALDTTRDLTMLARVNYVGTSSLEVGVRVEQPNETHFGSCYFTMVAQPRGRELLPLHYHNEIDRRRKAEAIQRRAASTREGTAIAPPTREEQALLAELHMTLEGRGFEGRLVCDLVSRGYERPDLEHERAPARISGGFVTHRAYLHAATCAELIAPDKPLLVAVNRINFLQPVRPGDTLHFTSRVTYTGATSICVEVDIVRESSDHSTAALCNTCTFTFRNVDAALGGRPVPTVYPTTYAEDLRYLAAHRRRATARSEHPLAPAAGS